MTSEAGAGSAPAGRANARPPRAAGWIALLAAAGVAAFLWLRPRSDEPAPTDGRAAPSSSSGVHFEDRTEEAGITFRMAFLPNEQGAKFRINLYDHGCGVAVADYDGDGDDDLYFCNQLGPNALYRNDGKGHFTDVTAAAGPLAVLDRISVAAAFGDVDGDGDQDLYVTTTRGGNLFFRNRGDGTFVDETEKAGLVLVAHSETPTFFDADRDGDLDLLVTNTAHWTTDEFDAKEHYYVGPAGLFDLIASPREHDRYYRNKGDGTFEDVTEAVGLAGVGWSGDVAVFDYDGDGALDVFVANMFGRCALYRNDGKGVFRDVTRETLRKTSWGTVGSRAFDQDGDGLLDLYLVDMHSDMWMVATADPGLIPEGKKFDSAFGPSLFDGSRTPEDEKKFIEKVGYDPAQVVFGNTLFHNVGGGKFEEVSDRVGAETLWPWGIATGDFDGDGLEDAYLPSGMGFPYEYWRSPLLMNDGKGRFVDRSSQAGLDPPRGGRYLAEPLAGRKQSRSSRSAATGDFDGDGRLDLVVNNFNDRPFLLMNRGPKTPWVELKLSGVESPRDAIGAVVRLYVTLKDGGSRVLVRQVQAAGGYLAQSSNTLHFGLGTASRVDRAEIQWPGGRLQKIDGLEIGRRHEIREPTR